nr:copper chaperone PCu(A)C [uncultured Pseudoxanthomonas sp.]
MKLPLVSLLALLLAACQPTPQGAAGDGGHAGGISVASPWLRETPPGAPVAGGFLTLQNPSSEDDRLLAVESALAQRVEIHAMRDEGGVARMRELADGLLLPGGAMVELQPGGHHLMFIQPQRPLQAGEHVDATLVFERAGRVPVTFEVRPLGASGAASHH